MSRPETLHWLGELQRRFGGVLRAPLAAHGGELGPDPTRYPSGACDDVLPTPKLTAAARLGIYQRQYWMRLLKVMQEQYPLTTRLLGASSFNQHAMRFLQACPPASHDLGRSVEGFDGFLERESSAPSLVQAARIDAAYRLVFSAPEQPSWSLASADEATLAAGRLQLSAAVRCVEEHWPLLELRASSLASDADRALALPPRLPRAQHWLVFRTDRGVGHGRIAPAHARLFELLRQDSLGQALAKLQSECPETERERLPESIRDFFAAATRAGCFTGWSAT